MQYKKNQHLDVTTDDVYIYVYVAISCNELLATVFSSSLEPLEPLELYNNIKFQHE